MERVTAEDECGAGGTGQHPFVFGLLSSPVRGNRLVGSMATGHSAAESRGSSTHPRLSSSGCTSGVSLEPHKVAVAAGECQVGLRNAPLAGVHDGEERDQQVRLFIRAIRSPDTNV